jgi:soluble lytic murein transglycosylase
LIEKYAGEMGLGAEILYGLIHTESLFMSDVSSWVGAIGLVQLMPATAEEMAGRIVRQGGPDYRGSETNLRDPEINIHIGSYYLRYLTQQMQSPMLALLAYNGGMGRVRRWLAADRRRGVLPLDLFLETVEYTETREYGRRVLAAAAAYGYLYYGMSMEEVAADIYPADRHP